MKLAHSGTYVFDGTIAASARLSHAQAAAGNATPVAPNRDAIVKPVSVVDPTLNEVK
jgi:hypothetical protein